MISSQDLSTLREIFRDDYSLDFTDEETRRIGTQLVNLYGEIFSPEIINIKKEITHEKKYTS